MRRAVVSCCLVAMLAGATVMAAGRESPRIVETVVATSDSAPAVAVDTPAPVPAAAPVAPTASPPVAVPLSVVASSWELLAPAVLPEHGGSNERAFVDAGVALSLSATSDPAELEARLGRGGVAGGADVALMPLPVFVASYERLRALSPQVFFVVAWSRGGDVLTGNGALMIAPPAKGKVVLAGRPGSAETMVGLFALEAAGVSAARVEQLATTAAPPGNALHSQQRRRSREIDARKVLLSTADAVHLVPIVAVAPKGVLVDKHDALVGFSRVWLEGVARLELDPPSAARKLAAHAGAPQAVDLIDALGWLEFVELPEMAAASGLAGRRAASLDVLFAETWTLWRDSGLLATPPPEHAPLNAVVIAELVGSSSTAGTPRTARRWAEHSGSGSPILVRRIPGHALDDAAEAALVGELGFLADVFARSRIRVWVPRDPETGHRVAVRAAERFGLDPEQIVVRSDRGRPRATAAVLEVLRAS